MNTRLNELANKAAFLVKERCTEETSWTDRAEIKQEIFARLLVIECAKFVSSGGSIGIAVEEIPDLLLEFFGANDVQT